MIKKIALLILIICSLLVLAGPGPVQAAGGLAVLNSSVQLNFPASITFNISASSDVNITDIRLHYLVNRMEFVHVVSEVYLTFTPSTRVSTKWVWDMRKTGGLPPGTSVDYWWTVTDAAGKTVETMPARLEVKDNQHSWHSISQGDVTLYWYNGSNSFAAELMTAIQDALVRLEVNTGAEIENPVSFYIYANQSDLLKSMIFPQEWTGGVTFVLYNVIAIPIGPNASDIAWGKLTIAHELTHVVIHQVTYNPYNYLPTWLNEGMAKVSEGELDPYLTDVLNQAKSKNALISVRSLSSPFSADAFTAYLSYAESYEVVKYLIDTYGKSRMFELLNTFAQGSDYDEALLKVYGFDMDGLNAKWRASFEGAAVR